MKVPEAGSHSRSEFGPASKPSSMKTSPVGSRDMWTATRGHATGALQSPIWSGVDAVTAALEPLRRISIMAMEHAASAERCHDATRRRCRWV